MNKENNMELKSEYVEVEVLGYGLPLYNAIGSSGDKVIYEGIEYDSTMINAWEVLTGSSTIQIGGQCCNQHCTSSHPDDLVGAHVVLSQPTQALQPDEEFYIVPLCRGCNSSGPGQNIPLRCAVKAARMSWIGK